MNIDNDLIKKLKSIEDEFYENAEQICFHFGTFDAYDVSVNSEKIFFTTVQSEGNHWKRVCTFDEFNKLIREQAK
jgi:hypothetical protein